MKNSIRKEKKFILKKDIVIKAGTVFQCIDGRTSEYASGNYSVLAGVTKDSSGEFIYGIDEGDKQLKKWFKEIK